MQEAMERVIATMWDRYSEPLSLTEMADTAILSRFHFSRVFRTMTGTSPCRFLAAVRLYKAKNLLLETSLSVTDISYMVGYNSLGTFTSRFTWSVGASPARYRLLSHVGMPLVPSYSSPNDARPTGVVNGLVNMPDTGAPLRVYIAAFDSPIAQGLPTSCDVLDSSGPYHLGSMPPGDWFIRAAAVATTDVDPRPWIRRPLFVGECHRITVRPGHSGKIDLDMHPVGPLDLPILLALPELDSVSFPEAEPAPDLRPHTAGEVVMQPG